MNRVRHSSIVFYPKFRIQTHFTRWILYSKDAASIMQVTFRRLGVSDHLNAPIAFSVGVRLEADGGDQYANRLELAPMRANEQWGYYRAELSAGTNIVPFLQEMKSGPSRGLRVVWSQLGRADDYSAGDTLLIDVVAIVQTTMGD
jgi:hypothetical protein